MSTDKIIKVKQLKKSAAIIRQKIKDLDHVILKWVIEAHRLERQAKILEIEMKQDGIVSDSEAHNLESQAKILETEMDNLQISENSERNVKVKIDR